jgi:hypothetical protein
VPVQIGDAPLVARQDPAQQYAGGSVAVRHHALRFDVRRRGNDAGEDAELLHIRPPVADATLESRQSRMRREAEDPGAQLLLEAVHDRQHDDQHRDADAEAEDRDAGDQRHEPPARRGAQVAQTEEAFVPGTHHS